ncbi:glutathione S-transferase [Novosphingobium malaysiense]|uniref:Glutathione S-transferase n=1 Tax=Novosphingobium malaysiense TaxID=1348853 RepID=A0A0B1ZP71_9SPHN|nr:glutathione S-transferase [Novosphingobium malaysiense]KHK90972.1 glutathione S-transferase [Novosphingobium malaysiense]
MAEFDLYYWPAPFRGQFIRAILAFAGKRWIEHDAGEIGEIMGAEPREQPVPFMGPPVLVDKSNDFALAEMPAIALYLGDCLNLIPGNPQTRAMTAKVTNDANDVLDEITLDGGREMWTQEKWEEFLPRLKRWMAIWEVTGKRHGLEADRGFLLGTGEAGVADVVTATLWSTMGERFASIAQMLDETAPCTAALVQRMQNDARLAALQQQAREDYGDSYCGGEIERSLRAVVG